MRSALLFGLILLVAPACSRQKEAGGAPGVTAAPAAVGEGKALLEQGRVDEALAKLAEAGADPDGLYYQGLAWVRKSESAPLPTPPPLASPLPRGATPPPAPEYKPEELTALGLLEQATAARAQHPGAHLAIARLLAPHAARRHDHEREAAKKPARRGHKPPPEPAAPAGPGPDDSAQRIAREFQAAVTDPALGGEAIEGLIAFARRVELYDAAAPAFEELVRRQPERPDAFARYGDFLAQDKKDPLAAVEQYKQALVWNANDAVTKAKVLDIYLALGAEHWAATQYAAAEARFREAKTFVTDPNSPQAQRLQGYLDRLRELRGR